MQIFFWALMGATIGWIAAILSGKSSFKDSLPSIAVGIVGALLGGLYVQAIKFDPSSTKLSSSLMAIVGAILVITSYKAIKDK